MDQENKVISGVEVAENNVQEGTTEAVEAQQTYAVVLHPVPASLKKQFSLALDDLRELQKEIAEKMQLAAAHNESIQARIHRLVNDAKVEINQEHYHHFNQSIAVYMNLLKDIYAECGQELDWSTQILELENSKTVQVPLDFDADFYRWALGHDALTDEEITRVINQKIEQIRRHAKVVRKDVRVSFSRYLFGFSAQLKQVEVIEHSLVKNYFAHQAHQAREAKKKQQESAETTSTETATP